jgi:type II secretory pathway component PulM
MKLASRDKKALIFGGSAVAIILLYMLVLSPFLNDLSRKRDLIPKKERDLAEMQKRGPLLTEIENIAKRANLSGKIVSLKPQPATKSEGFTESVVEVRLDNISLYDIVNFVYQVESATFRVRKLAFKPRYDNPKLLSATLLVSSAG